jgi:2-dehydro-3-deoxygluconokinase
MAQAGIIALGEPLIEFNQTQPGEPSYRQGFGGDTSNFVIAAARQGAACAYITKLGDDEFGKMFLQLWQCEGVATDGVGIDVGAHTAVYFISHHEHGHAFTYLRAGSAASRIAPSDLDADLIRNARFLHVSGVSQAISSSACDTVFAAIDIARAAGVAVSYDPNLRLKLWPLARARAVIRATIGLSDYFFPSLEDLQAISGLKDADAILDWCLAQGTKTILLKLGPDGAIVADAARRTRVAGIEVQSVDATGAGDCFAGAFIARIAAGDDAVAAARYANAAAALTTTGYGAVAPIPHAEQVAALLRKEAAD